MTERAQPGAIDSVVRNDELAQVFGQLTGGYGDGWVVPADEPTPAAQRRSDIDTSDLNAFEISTSASSLDVTVDGGEAFAAGWCAIDTATTLSLPASTTSTVVVTWDPDAVYDSSTDADRDAADSVVVTRAANVSNNAPRAVLFDVETDTSGVVGVTDRRQIGPAVDLDAGRVESAPSSDSDIARLADVNTALTSITSLGRNINNLTQEVARTQFEVGLSELGYPTGFYDAFVDSSKVAEFTGVEISSQSLVLLSAVTFGAEQTESPFSGHTAGVNSVALDSVDEFGYSGSGDDTVRKWDTATMTGASDSPFSGHSNRVQSVALDSVDEFGYSGASDDTVRKWDTATMTEAPDSPFSGHAGSVTSVALDSADEFGYSGGGFGSDYAVRKWGTDTLSEQSESPFSGHTDNVESVTIDSADEFGYSGARDNTVRKWDTATMTEASDSPFSGHTGIVLSVALDSAGEFGYSGANDDTVRKWDTATMTEASDSPFSGHTDGVAFVTIDSAGEFGYSGAFDGTVRKWDTATMTEASDSPFSGHSNSVQSVALDSADEFGYSGSSDDTVRKWATGNDATTEGNAKTPFKDIGIVPDRLVIGRDATVPQNTTLNYKVEDDAGNVETFTESEVDAEVSLPSISTSNVRTTLVLDRNSTDDPTPELNSYALYLSE